MIQTAYAGIIFLFILARSNLSTGRRIKVEINNPFDQLTQGQVIQGRPVQPTYGKIKVWFSAPSLDRVKRIGKSNDGSTVFYVYKIGSTVNRVDITVPNGEIGAGQTFNRSNWFQQNSGEGYYVIRQRLKTWNGSTYPSQYPASYRQIGLNNYFYETAQRYQVFDNADDAITSAEQILEAFNNATGDTGGTPSLPPPTSPPQPEAPPTLPPSLPPAPATPPTGEPLDPKPLNPDVGDNWGGGSTFGGFTQTAGATFIEQPVNYGGSTGTGMDFQEVAMFTLNSETIDTMKKRRIEDPFGAKSERREGEGEREGEREGEGEEQPPEYYYEQFRSSEGAREGGFQNYMTENHSGVDTSGYDFEAFP
jgi:hypothetical protein